MTDVFGGGPRIFTMNMNFPVLDIGNVGLVGDDAVVRNEKVVFDLDKRFHDCDCFDILNLEKLVARKK